MEAPLRRGKPPLSHVRNYILRPRTTDRPLHPHPRSCSLVRSKELGKIVCRVPPLQAEPNLRNPSWLCSAAADANFPRRSCLLESEAAPRPAPWACRPRKASTDGRLNLEGGREGGSLTREKVLDIGNSCGHNYSSAWLDRPCKGEQKKILFPKASTGIHTDRLKGN